MAQQKGLPANYDPVRDSWILDVPFGVAQAQLTGVQRFLVKLAADRLLATPLPGDKRDMVLRSLKAAQAGRIEQRMCHKGDQDLFKSTERERPDRAFSFAPPQPSSRLLAAISGVVDAHNAQPASKPAEEPSVPSTQLVGDSNG